jgi:hypothetical protein
MFVSEGGGARHRVAVSWAHVAEVSPAGEIGGSTHSFELGFGWGGISCIFVAAVSAYGLWHCTRSPESVQCQPLCALSVAVGLFVPFADSRRGRLSTRP